MNPNKKIHYYLVASCLWITVHCTAQVNIARYFDESFLPAIDNSKYADVKFTWSLPGKVQATMNHGLTEMEAENFESAILNFDDVIQQHPAFWPAFYYRGICHKILNRFSESKKNLRVALQYEKNQAVIYTAFGDVCLLSRKLDSASLLHKTALKVDPTSAYACYSLGNIEFRQHHYVEARILYEKTTKIDDHFAPAYLMLGLLSVKEFGKKNKNALEYLDKALARDSLFREALFWRGFIYLNQEQTQKCIGDWDKLVRYYPSPFFLTMRGFLYVELNDYDRAFNDLRKAVLSNKHDEDKFVGGQTLLDKRIDVQFAAAYAMRFSYGLDENALVHFKKGFCHFLADNRESARDDFKKATAIQPSATVYFLTALNYEHMGVHDSAFVYYSKALTLDNDIFDAHKKRAIYRYETNDWKGAYRDFEDMIRIAPDNNVTYRLRGFIKAHQKEYPGAIIDLGRFAKSDSSDAEVYKTRGYCRGKINDKIGELADYRMALEILPEYDKTLVQEVIEGYATLGDTITTFTCIDRYLGLNPEGYLGRVRKVEIFMSIGYWDHAFREIERASKESTSVVQRSEIDVLRGLAYFHQGKYEQSISHFTNAITQRSTNFEARYFRGKAYMSLGRKEEAISDFKILKSNNYQDAQVILSELKKK